MDPNAAPPAAGDDHQNADQQPQGSSGKKQNDNPSTPAHALALRVMRLAKPAFRVDFPSSGPKTGLEASDIAFVDGNGNAQDGSIDSTSNEPQNSSSGDFGASSALVLPSAFGSIFLGESFGCFLSVSNVLGDSKSTPSSSYSSSSGKTPSQTARNVRARAELQTTTKKHVLLGETTDKKDQKGGSKEQMGQAATLTELSPGESHDFVVEHEVTELGVHILVATITYDIDVIEQSQGQAEGSGKNETAVKTQTRHFRKFFKFQVMNPIHFRTTIHDLQHGIFVTALVQNASPVPLYFELVKFNPSPLFTCRDFNGDSPEAKRREEKHDEDALPTGEDVVLLKTNDVQQYLFQLLPKNPRDAATVATRDLGKIDIVWRSQLGSKGRLQTAPLERRLQQSAEVELMFDEIPSHITLEEPFQVKASVTNRSQRTMNVSLNFLPRTTVPPGAVGEAGSARVYSHGIAHAGLSGIAVGTLKPDGTHEFELSLVPLKPGVQKLAGVRIVDHDAQRVYNFHECLELFVF
jgi:trafficking protein particle complex subunit 13